MKHTEEKMEEFISYAVPDDGYIWIRKDDHEKAIKEVAKLKTMSTIEMMCENENVKCHIQEWEKRCLSAEQKVKADEKAIKTMDEILHLSKQLVYDEAFGGCVRKVILKWEEEINGSEKDF